MNVCKNMKLEVLKTLDYPKSYQLKSFTTQYHNIILL